MLPTEKERFVTFNDLCTLLQNNAPLSLLDRFQRATVDLTLPWRFANLPNNAKLEMVASTRKPAVTDSQVS